MDDNFVEENSGSLYLHVKNNSVELTDGPRADVVLRTNIADLSSFVMGAIPLSAFLWTGRMTCSDRSYEQDIQNALGWSRKPKNYTYF